MTPSTNNSLIADSCSKALEAAHERDHQSKEADRDSNEQEIVHV